jgi:hypothetical protein
MKCHRCGKETEIKTWLSYRYGIESPEKIYQGNWCDQCFAFTGTVPNITEEVKNEMQKVRI